MNAYKRFSKLVSLSLLAAPLLILPLLRHNVLAQQHPSAAAQPKSASDQPHMSAALEHLKLAEREIDQAESDKGGHRQKAVQLVRQAIAEVQAGMRYADLHPPKKK
jgi:hypothetical protein